MNPFIESFQALWDHPTSVFIDPTALDEVASKMGSQPFPTPAWREPVFPPADDATFINFLGVGNSINFAFTDFLTHESFSVKYKDKVWRGAFAMWASLARAVESGLDILNGDCLRKLDLSQCRDIFAGESGIPMLEERWQILRGVGDVLTRRYDGFFSNLFEAAKFKAFGGTGIVDRLLSEFPSFVDESLHRESRTLLRFEKRAQLLPMMYQGRALASDTLSRLPDFHDLGPIADYAVPRALKKVRILKYSAELEQKIKARTMIEKDSLEEQEIRAQTVKAQLDLLQKLRTYSQEEVTVLSLDYKVWTLGGGASEPHHLTLTTAY